MFLILEESNGLQFSMKFKIKTTSEPFVKNLSITSLKNITAIRVVNPFLGEIKLPERYKFGKCGQIKGYLKNIAQFHICEIMNIVMDLNRWASIVMP